MFIAFTFFGKEALPADFDLVIITGLFSVFFTEGLRLVFFLVSDIYQIYGFLIIGMHQLLVGAFLFSARVLKHTALLFTAK